MVRKKWLVREAVAEERDVRRLEKVAVLVGNELEEEEENWRSFYSSSGDEAARGRAQDDISLMEEASSLGRPANGERAGRRLPMLNENQLAVMAELAAVGGCMRGRDLKETVGLKGVPGIDL